MAKKNPEKEIEDEVIDLVKQQKELETQELELMQDPRFAKFIQAQKKFKDDSEIFWGTIENGMIKNDIKSIKGEWGSITIAERQGFDIEIEKLPSKFLKKSPDLKKIGDSYKLTGVAPAGAVPKLTKYLMKRIK